MYENNYHNGFFQHLKSRPNSITSCTKTHFFIICQANAWVQYNNLYSLGWSGKHFKVASLIMAWISCNCERQSHSNVYMSETPINTMPISHSWLCVVMTCSLDFHLPARLPLSHSLYTVVPLMISLPYSFIGVSG